MKLVLIRHGAAAENAQRRFLGVTDSPLSPVGIEQARSAAPFMPAVEHIYSSPLCRCRQTAQLLWPNAGLTVIPGLRESDFGPFEGKSHAELEGSELYEQWLQSPENPALSDLIESPSACRQRAEAAFLEIIRACESRGLSSAGIISHGGTLMNILSIFAEPKRDFYDWSLKNCHGFAGQLEGLRLRITAEI